MVKRFDVSRLDSTETCNRFESICGGLFTPLIDADIEDIEETYESFKELTAKASETVIGYKRKKCINGLPIEIELKCEQRRTARRRQLDDPANLLKREDYKRLNREVKAAVRDHKNNLLEEKIQEMEENFEQHKSHDLFRAVRELEGKPRKQLNAVKDAQGVIRTEQREVLTRWKEHFEAHLNHTFPRDNDALEDLQGQPDEVNRDEPEVPITKEEI